MVSSVLRKIINRGFPLLSSMRLVPAGRSEPRPGAQIARQLTVRQFLNISGHALPAKGQKYAVLRLAL
jgi:hypothetical protein